MGSKGGEKKVIRKEGKNRRSESRVVVEKKGVVSRREDCDKGGGEEEAKEARRGREKVVKWVGEERYGGSRVQEENGEGATGPSGWPLGREPPSP